ncbi:hypothetical protein RLW55_01360 [Hyphomicrobium sp. B1]|uniref:hypothetical protein n=1 Tax=unclassified Hyphomicrobium TaxID=2619925 RepID=UPI00391AD95B
MQTLSSRYKFMIEATCNKYRGIARDLDVAVAEPWSARNPHWHDDRLFFVDWVARAERVLPYLVKRMEREEKLLFDQDLDNDDSENEDENSL